MRTAMMVMKWLLCALLSQAFMLAAAAAERSAPVHGLWLWKSSLVLQAPSAVQALDEFCRASAITEVYVSVPSNYSALEGLHLAQLITQLHGSGVRVEALLSSTNADEPGGPRTKLLDHVQSILQFNRQHPAQRFDGVHLDIEPQQRPENKGPGNLQFLPGLVQAYRAVRVLTERAGLTLNADIQNKLLKGDLEQRRSLLSAVPRLTLMLYELSAPDDGSSAADKKDKVLQSAASFFKLAYQDLPGQELAKMAIALRTPDYGAQLPQMLAALDAANVGNPHYLGWARHSYNDVLNAESPP
jgi:hypothetical protein